VRQDFLQNKCGWWIKSKQSLDISDIWKSKKEEKEKYVVAHIIFIFHRDFSS